MSTYRRPRVSGATVFLTANLQNRGADTLVRYVDLMRQAVVETRAKRPFGIDAWVVLPDHFHCVWTLPEGDADYSVRMAAIKARFTMDLRRSGFTPTPTINPHGAIGGRRRGGVNPDLQKDEAPIWQKRFWEHHIRGQRDFEAAVRYCWINPVKHGLVERPEDWPHSSWHRNHHTP